MENDHSITPVEDTEYFLVGDVDIWQVFNANHTSKKLDRAQLERATVKPRLVDTAPAPVPPRPEASDAWLQSAALSCPGCVAPLRVMIRTQGQGGWHAVLDHLCKCRTACGDSVGMEDAVAAAWSQALSAAHRKDHARAAAKKQRAMARCTPCTTNTISSQPETPALHCKSCQKEFRASDTASLASHQAACLAKQKRTKELNSIAVEATEAKLHEAKLKLEHEKQRAAAAQGELKEARVRGMELAKEQKAQRRREAKKASGKRAAAVNYHAPVEEQQKDGPAGTKQLEKAERTAATAKRRLAAAQATVLERQQVADAVKQRAEGVHSPRVKPKVGAPVSRKEAFLPAHKRAATWQQQGSATERKGGKKQSKEAKALAAKTKSEAKKERRGGGHQKGAMHVVSSED